MSEENKASERVADDNGDDDDNDAALRHEAKRTSDGEAIVNVDQIKAIGAMEKITHKQA